MKKFLFALALIFAGQTFAAGTVLKTIGDVSFNNMVINGGDLYSQRAASASVGTSLAYQAQDRFSFIKSGTCAPTVSTNTTVLRTGARSNATKKFTWTSASCDFVGMRHKWEAAQIFPLIGQKVSISFWVYFNTVSGLHSVDAIHVVDAAPSAVDNWATQTAFLGGNVITTIPSSAITAGVWKQVTASWTVPITVGAYNTTNGYGFDIELDWDSATAVAPNVYVAEIQVNEGPSVTPFRLAGGTVGGELALAQRYAYKISNNGNSSYPLATGWAISTSAAIAFVPLPVSMRIIPTTLLTTGTASDYRTYDGTATCQLTSVPTISANSFVNLAQINLTCSSASMTAFRPYQLVPNASAVAYLLFDAEL